MIILSSSCRSDKDNRTIELKNQQVGITSIHNARQLGGYVIGDKQIRKDVLLRTGRLAELSAEDSAVLADRFRVQCVYDFRGHEESRALPDVMPGDARYMSLSIPMTISTGSSAPKAQSEAELIGMLLKYAEEPFLQDVCANLYNRIFFEKTSHEVYRRFFADLMTINPEDGAIIWHCTQGKDRAGSASAMLLAALGADRELIMADYRLSKEYYDKLVAHVKLETEAQSIVINTLITANPALFEKALDTIDEKYGSFCNYLTECIGVTPEMMETLRERFLE